MPDYEIQRERIVEREAPVVERVVPVEARRTVVERRSGDGFGGLNPVSGLIMAMIVVLVLLLVFGVLV